MDSKPLPPSCSETAPSMGRRRRRAAEAVGTTAEDETVRTIGGGTTNKNDESGARRPRRSFSGEGEGATTTTAEATTSRREDSAGDDDDDDGGGGGDFLRRLARRTFDRMMNDRIRKKKKRKRNKRKRVGRSDDDDEASPKRRRMQPTPIQIRSWSAFGRGRFSGVGRTSGRGRSGRGGGTAPQNVVGIAPTGSGKTLAYGLPLVASCAERRRVSSSVGPPPSPSPPPPEVRGLVLVPTRELASQVARELDFVCKVAAAASAAANDDLSSSRRRRGVADGNGEEEEDAKDVVKTIAIRGGDDRDGQLDLLFGRRRCRPSSATSRGRESAVVRCGGEATATIVVATPGRLLDLMSAGDDGSDGSSDGRRRRPPGEEDDVVGSSLLRSVRFVVVDEFDRMATSGELSVQVDDVLKFVRGSKENGEGAGQRGGEGGDGATDGGDDDDDYVATTWLFSATMPQSAAEKCDEWIGHDRPRVMIRAADSTMTATIGGGRRSIDGGRVDSDKDDTRDGGNAVGEGARRSAESSQAAMSDVVAGEADKYNNNNKGGEGPCGASRKRGNDGGRGKDNRGQMIDVGGAAGTRPIPSNVTQTLHVCSDHKKPRKLVTTLDRIRRGEDDNDGINDNGDDAKGGGRRRRRQRGLCVVFFGRIKTLKYVGKLVRKEGVKCVELHGQMNQQNREKTLHDFKAGKVTTLLATDVAARGLHVNNLRYVINYDFPSSIEQYVHRCGRAGRDGSPATSYSFFNRQLAPMARDVVSLLRSCNATIDPNLLELVKQRGGDDNGENVNDGEDASDSDAKGGKNKRRRPRRAKKRKGNNDDAAREGTKEIWMARRSTGADDLKTGDVDAADEDAGWDDGQFASLSGSRIVLKRAHHVSDASSSSDDDDSDDDDDDE